MLKIIDLHLLYPPLPPTSSGASMAVPSMPISPVSSPFLGLGANARVLIFLARICRAWHRWQAAGVGDQFLGNESLSFLGFWCAGIAENR